MKNQFVRLAALTSVLFATAVAASATPITYHLQFVQATGSDGGYGTGPYQLMVNGVLTNLVCIDPNHDIVAGESWDAYRVNVTTLGTTAEAQWILASEILGNNNADFRNDAQFAIWGMTNSNFTHNPAYDADSAALAAQALALVGNYNFPNYASVYVAIAGTQSVGGTAQSMGAVPEPASLALLGSGMLGLVGVARKKIRF